MAAVALAGVAGCLALVVTGAVVERVGPALGREDIRRLGIGIVDTVYVHVRVVAVFGIGFLIVASWLVRHRREVPRLSRRWPAGCSACCSCRWCSVRCSTAPICRGGSC